MIYRTVLYLFATVSIFSSCTDLIEYSPFDTGVHSRSLNLAYADCIASKVMSGDTLRIAYFSDSHSYFDHLNSAVSRINRRGRTSFAISGGDVADAGLAYQYKAYIDVIEKCAVPVFTTIGNHDYRSNGEILFKRLFGPTNSSFVYGDYKFIFFDDVVWENGNGRPDFDWLEQQISDTTYSNILIAHIMPGDEQLEGEFADLFARIVTVENTLLCLHGHAHGFSDSYFNGIRSIIPGRVKRRSYCEISLVGKEIILENIAF